MTTLLEVLACQFNYWIIVFLLGVSGIGLILYFLFRLCRDMKKYVPLIVFVVLILVELVVGGILGWRPTGYPHLLYITEPFSMLYGLLIYLYARNHANLQLKVVKTDWLLLIPFVMALITYLPYYLLPAEEKLADLAEFGSVHTDVLENIWEWNFEIVVNAAFLLAALRELKKFNFKIKERFSDVHRVDLHITQWMIKICLATYLLEFFFVYSTYFGFPYYRELFDIFNIANYAILAIIGYDALVSYQQIDNLQNGWASLPKTEIELDGTMVKYAKSALNEAKTHEIKNELVRYMQAQEPYLQPQLRIKELADQTGIASHHLSQVINESFHQNFYEFVNAYRVEAAKKMLKDPKYKKYTYTAIGFEVGFNSKSAFYSAFKKHTGITPAKF